MSNFEKITASPEVLGAFLSSFSTVNGPWDAEFHKRFCAACDREDCDGKPCPHQGKRSNPEWWLRLGAKQGETDGLVVRIKAAFPIEWDKEYYTVAETKKEQRAPCTCCDNTGKVEIKGTIYTCPRCKGNWREKEVIGTTTVYYVAKWELEKVSVTQAGIALGFRQTNNKENYNKYMEVKQKDFHDMVQTDYGNYTKIYDDYKTVVAEVKRLNAAEREKQK